MSKKTLVYARVFLFVRLIPDAGQLDAGKALSEQAKLIGFERDATRAQKQTDELSQE